MLIVYYILKCGLFQYYNKIPYSQVVIKQA